MLASLPPPLLLQILPPRMFPLHYYSQILPSFLAAAVEFGAGTDSGKVSSPLLRSRQKLAKQCSERVLRSLESMPSV